MRRLAAPARAAAGSARAAIELASVPVRAAAAGLASPGRARRDPTVVRVAELCAAGWRPVAVRLAPRRTEVDLEREGERRTVEGDTLAFAVFESLAGSRAGAAVTRTRA